MNASIAPATFRTLCCGALLALAAVSCAAQTVVVTQTPEQAAAATLPGTMNRMNIALDAAHGGADNGARIADGLLEKDITLALALKLQSLLSARGFNVAMTRTTDAADKPGAGSSAAALPLTLDDRAGALNRARGSACLLLHATGSGIGVHLYSSELDGVPLEAAVLPWATAQTAWVVQSAQLERQLATALRQAGVPRIAGRASVRPVDSLTCPAVVVELGPENEDIRSITGVDYQQRVAETLAGALEAWSKLAQPPPRLPFEQAKPKPAPATAKPVPVTPPAVQP